MKTTFKAAFVAASLAAGSAQAVTIDVSVFDIDAFNNATNFANFVIEDFETGFTAGAVGASLSSSVGTFESLGGVGSGSTCIASGVGPACTELAIFDSSINSQGNSLPLDGEFSLNSNDTLGIGFDVNTGSVFNRVVFALSDAGDQGALVEIFADDGSSSASFNLGAGLANGNSQLVVIDFGGAISDARINIDSGQVNDGFAIDGVSVGVVPLPAAGFLLLGGLGALGAMRRKKKS